MDFFHALLCIFLELCPNNVILDSITRNDVNNLNFKLSKLKLLNKMSKSTCETIRTVLNHFVLQLWSMVFISEN